MGATISELCSDCAVAVTSDVDCPGPGGLGAVGRFAPCKLEEKQGWRTVSADAGPEMPLVRVSRSDGEAVTSGCAQIAAI